MSTALKRIYLHAETKNTLGNILPKNITYDMFVRAVIAYLKTTGLTIEDILDYLPKPSDVPPEIEALMN